MLRIVLVLHLNIGYLLNNVVSDKTHVKMEIAKCYGADQAVKINTNYQNSICVDFTGVYKKLLNLSSGNITVYDKDSLDKPTNKEFNDYFRVTLEKVPNNTIFENLYGNVDDILSYNVNEDGALYLEYPNAYTRWISVNNSLYCIDYMVKNYEKQILSDTYTFWIYQFSEGPTPTHGFYTSALMVSVVFLTLVLIVYILLPGLRNLGGKVLMAYAFSLLMSFLLLAIIQQSPIDGHTCLLLSTILYFFFLASFCWMNIMSYDIWWTFRGFIKIGPIHRRGETFKFLMYCLYGWGVPLAMSVAFAVINNADLSHMPWFVKPQIPKMGCFLEGGQKLVYLHAPMLILILSNWIFFLITAFNIWRLNRDTAVLESSAAGTPQAHKNIRKQRNRYFIYLKLSIIMGINWVLEVISPLAPRYHILYISDAYNALIGFAIFVIFVCKKRIYRELRVRFSKIKVPQPSLTNSQTNCAMLSAVSQDTPLQLIQHPIGTSNRHDDKF